MIAGHFGFAALVKSREQSIPLWILMLASVWLDVVFVPLFLAGIETIRLIQGHSGYGAALIYAEASDGGICRHSAEAWVSNENPLGLKSQLTR
jgi:hypothetical protein